MVVGRQRACVAPVQPNARHLFMCLPAVVTASRPTNLDSSDTGLAVKPETDIRPQAQAVALSHQMLQPNGALALPDRFAGSPRQRAVAARSLASNTGQAAVLGNSVALGLNESSGLTRWPVKTSTMVFGRQHQRLPP